MEDDQDWIKEAMANDTMVVELLVRLNKAHSTVTPPSPPSPLKWSVRQPRSKPVTVNNIKNRAPRASPTTPLSWSGATSISGGAIDGCSEESSRSPPVVKLPNSSTRSKVNGTTGGQKNKKRSRKKKTLAQLKEEEESLLQERRELKREVAALRVNFEKQRAVNESLKRMKIELQQVPSIPEETTPSQLHQELANCHTISATEVLPQSSPLKGCIEQNYPTAPKAKFALPDLNMPFEEESSYEVMRAVC